MPEPVRFSDAMTIRCAPGIAELVDRAALARGQKPSEWTRQALATALRLDGFDPAAIPARDAGSLYNTVSGQRCYALVSGDRIVSMAYYATEPKLDDFAPGRGDRVLPVDHEDSEPFDAASHWRLPPIDRIEGDRVVRLFQIVPKSWEAAS